jgi:hypothetical protein
VNTRKQRKEAKRAREPERREKGKERVANQLGGLLTSRLRSSSTLLLPIINILKLYSTGGGVRIPLEGDDHFLDLVIEPAPLVGARRRGARRTPGALVLCRRGGKKETHNMSGPPKPDLERQRAVL